jgi:hypothetical protein
MAVRLEAWIGSRSLAGTVAQPASESRVLSLEARRARLLRRRRRSRAQGALEGAIWLAGSGVIVLIALAGVFGLR